MAGTTRTPLKIGSEKVEPAVSVVVRSVVSAADSVTAGPLVTVPVWTIVAAESTRTSVLFVMVGRRDQDRRGGDRAVPMLVSDPAP